jgi:hypothetical protein
VHAKAVLEADVHLGAVAAEARGHPGVFDQLHAACLAAVFVTLLGFHLSCPTVRALMSGQVGGVCCDFHCHCSLFVADCHLNG